MLQHFGFDDAAVVDSLVVEWPSGNTCVFTQVQVNQILDILEDCTIQATQAAAALPGSTQTLSECFPSDTLQLITTSPAGGTWTSDCGNCISATGLFDPQGLSAGTYLVRYQQGGICGGTLDSFLIQLLPAPSLELSADTTVNEGVNLPLLASGAVIYQWQPGGSLSCADCPDPTFSADTTTVFVVSGQDAFGCVDTDSMTVTVLPEPHFDLPNAFSPNGDGKNDVFGPAFKGDIFEQYHLRVFSRWGEMVYESRISTQGWNGTVSGTPLPSDVYVYLFDYQLIDGRSGHEKGEVTLLR